MAEQIRADLGAGARVVIIGIDGSPSMGVELTASAGDWGGRPDKPRDEDYPVTPGPGLFTETLLGLLGDDVARARVVGIGQDLFDYDEPAELAKLAAAVEDPVRGDLRSRRVAVVADSVLNPPAGGADHLTPLTEAGWGLVVLPPAGLPADTERR